MSSINPTSNFHFVHLVSLDYIKFLKTGVIAYKELKQNNFGFQIVSKSLYFKLMI